MNKTTPANTDPPRADADTLGEPVAEEQLEGEYYEVYADSKSNKIFVAKYKWETNEWVKQGLDRFNPSSLFNDNSWPTDD